MACKKCGSDWVTKSGKDCNRCPHCDKLQRCVARKEGRWVDPVEDRPCDVCGVTFQCVGLDEIRRKKCCGSVQCKLEKQRRKAAKNKARIKAGIPARQYRRLAERHCKRCGERLTKSHQKAYCSKACAGLDARERKRPVCGKTIAERLAFDLGSWFWAWESLRPKPNPSRKERASCDHCGKECNHLESRFCSYQCAKDWRGNRTCSDCGVAVSGANSRGLARCDSCKQKRLQQSRRKIKRERGSYRKQCRKHGGHYNSKCRRTEILERDNYVCHLCKRKCKKTLSHNDPRAATVDHHPVPLSKGGDHDWHNVRCACRRCNSIKSDSWDKQKRMRLEFN